MFGLTQLMMRKTEVVAASDQIHPRLQSKDSAGGMTRLARQAGQSLSKGGIQSLNTSRVEVPAPDAEHWSNFSAWAINPLAILRVISATRF
jgi:hypothetical protein